MRGRNGCSCLRSAAKVWSIGHSVQDPSIGVPGVRFVWMALLLMVPAAGATPTILHLHFVDGFQDGVLSTQPPPADLVAINGIAGPPTPPECVDVPSVQTFGGTWSASASVSGAWYEENQGEPFVQGKQGSAANITLTSDTASLHWAFTTSTASTTPTLPVAAIVLSAQLWQSRWTFADGEAFLDETLVAEGESGTILVAAEATEGATYANVDGLAVYDVDIPLAVTQTFLPAGELDSYGAGAGLRLVVTASQAISCPQARFPADVAALNVPDHRPALFLDVGPTLYHSYLDAQFVGPDLVLHLDLNSAWGKYDVGELRATITGPDGTTRNVPLIGEMAQRFHEHSPRDPKFGAGPMGHTFVLANHSLAHGTYAVHVEATDLAGTQTWSAQTTFEVVAPMESLTLPAGVWFVALVGLAALLRRR